MSISFCNNEELLKKAYREKIKLCTDNNKSLLINKAYSTLNNYVSRCYYDKKKNYTNVLPNDNQNINSSFPENIIKENLNSVSNSLENRLLNISKRLENLEKKIINKQIILYKEKEIINTIQKKNGEKTESHKIIINNNGTIKTNSKLLVFNKNNRIIKIYRN